MRVPYQAVIIGIALAFASAPSALAGGKGGGGGGVTHQDFQIQKYQDVASPKLYRTAPTGLTGKPIHKAWAGNRVYLGK
jgi:type VI protein secretion system component Hcp